MMKHSKYKNKKVVLDGITFDSKKEALRYRELQSMLSAGIITDLELQKKYVLIPSQRENKKVIERECAYIADFVYKKDGAVVVEDVKGYRDTSSAAYAKYTIKRKLMLYVHGIKIQEI